MAVTGIPMGGGSVGGVAVPPHTGVVGGASVRGARPRKLHVDFLTLLQNVS